MSLIRALETRLPAALKQSWPKEDWSGLTTKWDRRYVGIVRAGRKYIYGDFSPRGEGPVCDGGPAFFGVEYDVARKSFSHLAFNGEA